MQIAVKAARMWPSALIGTALGAMLTVVLASLVPMALTQYDAHNPVTEGTAKVVERAGNSVVIEVVAKRLRGEQCEFQRMGAVTVDPGGVTEVAYLERQGPGVGISHPEGTVHRSRWRVWPVDGATEARIVAVYACSGRIVTNVMGTADLTLARG